MSLSNWCSLALAPALSASYSVLACAATLTSAPFTAVVSDAIAACTCAIADCSGVLGGTTGVGGTGGGVGVGVGSGVGSGVIGVTGVLIMVFSSNCDLFFLCFDIFKLHWNFISISKLQMPFHPAAVSAAKSDSSCASTPACPAARTRSSHASYSKQ